MPTKSTRRTQCVVVGVHGTPGSVQALRYAADEARQRRANLIIVNAWIPFGGEAAERVTPCPELCRDRQDHARQEIEEACRQAEVDDDPTVKKCVVRGEPGKILTHIAGQEGDLLVVGTPRRILMTILRHTTVVRCCLRESRCPVVVVPSPANTPAVDRDQAS